MRWIKSKHELLVLALNSIVCKTTFFFYQSKLKREKKLSFLCILLQFAQFYLLNFLKAFDFRLDYRVSRMQRQFSFFIIYRKRERNWKNENKFYAIVYVKFMNFPPFYSSLLSICMHNFFSFFFSLWSHSFFIFRIRQKNAIQTLWNMHG